MTALCFYIKLLILNQTFYSESDTKIDQPYTHVCVHGHLCIFPYTQIFKSSKRFLRSNP